MSGTWSDVMQPARGGRLRFPSRATHLRESGWPRNPHTRRSPGFALVAALWLLVAIAAVGLDMSVRARERHVAAANALEGTRARAAAEAGFEHARAMLEQRLLAASGGGALPPELRLDPWSDLGSLFPDSVVFGDVRYRVTLRDANAALNLNTASEDELRGLLRALRVDYGDADRIAQAVADWRDPDDARRGRGAEREDYIRAGAAVLPRNGPFRELSELLHVRGVTPEIYESVKPYLTLVGTGRVNLNTAPRPVLLALPGLGEEAVAVLERARREGHRIRSVQELSLELSSSARAQLSAALPALLSRATFETDEVEVRVEGWTDSGVVRARGVALAVRTSTTAMMVSRSVE